MLSIYLGEFDEAIYHPPTYFDNRYEDEWITNPLSVDMIKDIDKSEVISDHLIDSPILVRFLISHTRNRSLFLLPKTDIVTWLL